MIYVNQDARPTIFCRKSFMNTSSLPVPLAQAVLSLMPATVLEKAVGVVFRRMRGRFPKLFKNLSQLPGATVLLAPTDIPHQFLLELGCDPVAFSVVQGQGYPATASISGPLESLIDMLEGRVDGDMLFFARDIRVTGDTSTIVALRNTLDREEINLFHEITRLCGPFAQPARTALTLADMAVRRLKERIARAHGDLHRKDKKEGVPVA